MCPRFTQTTKTQCPSPAISCIFPLVWDVWKISMFKTLFFARPRPDVTFDIFSLCLTLIESKISFLGKMYLYIAVHKNISLIESVNRHSPILLSSCQKLSPHQTLWGSTSVIYINTNYTPHHSLQSSFPLLPLIRVLFTVPIARRAQPCSSHSGGTVSAFIFLPYCSYYACFEVVVMILILPFLPLHGDGFHVLCVSALVPLLCTVRQRRSWNDAMWQ